MIIISISIMIIGQNYLIRNLIIKENYVTEDKRKLIMNGISNQYHISFSRHYMLFKMMKVLIKLFNDNNIDYFLICGGLLGYYRHNN